MSRSRCNLNTSVCRITSGTCWHTSQCYLIYYYIIGTRFCFNGRARRVIISSGISNRSCSNWKERNKSSNSSREISISRTTSTINWCINSNPINSVFSTTRYSRTCYHFKIYSKGSSRRSSDCS